MGRFLLGDGTIAQKFTKRKSVDKIVAWSDKYFSDIDSNTSLRGFYDGVQFVLGKESTFLDTYLLNLKSYMNLNDIDFKKTDEYKNATKQKNKPLPENAEIFGFTKKEIQMYFGINNNAINPQKLLENSGRKALLYLGGCFNFKIIDFPYSMFSVLSENPRVDEDLLFPYLRNNFIIKNIVEKLKEMLKNGKTFEELEDERNLVNISEDLQKRIEENLQKELKLNIAINTFEITNLSLEIQ